MRRARAVPRDATILWVVLVGLLGCLPLVLLTPPLQVPDEGQHFARAYQISEGRLWSEARNGRVGAELPASIDAFIVRFLGTDAEHAERSLKAEPLADTLSDRHRALAPSQRAFLGFEGAAFYSPLPYLPQAIAIGIGRLISISPLDLLYAGRLANALASLALLAVAMALAPGVAPVFAFVGLLPMTLYEDASVAPDGLVVGSALVFLAIVTRHQPARRWPVGAIVAAILAGLTFLSLKPVYAPLLVAGLVPDVVRAERRAATLRAHAIIVPAVLLLSWLWMRSTVSVFILPRPGTSLAGQAGFVASHPLADLELLTATLRRHAEFYYQSMIGVFGWVQIAPSGPFYLLSIGSAVASILASAHRRTVGSILGAAWLLSLAAAGAVLVLVALYLIWTPVGAATVEGVQGRYFIPLLPLLGLGVVRCLPSRLRVATAFTVFLGLVAAQIALMDLAIVGAYSVFG